MNKKRVAIIFGGKSAEHEISILSAKNVLEHLDLELFEPVLIGIDKKGLWKSLGEAKFLSEAKNPSTARLENGSEVSVTALGGNNSGFFINSRNENLAVDVVFPVLHGPFGEDGVIRGVFSNGDNSVMEERFISYLEYKGDQIRLYDFIEYLKS